VTCEMRGHAFFRSTPFALARSLSSPRIQAGAFPIPLCPLRIGVFVLSRLGIESEQFIAQKSSRSPFEKHEKKKKKKKKKQSTMTTTKSLSSLSLLSLLAGALLLLSTPSGAVSVPHASSRPAKGEQGARELCPRERERRRRRRRVESPLSIARFFFFFTTSTPPSLFKKKKLLLPFQAPPSATYPSPRPSTRPSAATKTSSTATSGTPTAGWKTPIPKRPAPL